MFGRIARRHAPEPDEAEKPFWISLSDLMTALMVLFLVVMALNITAVTSPGKQRQNEIEQFLQELDIEIQRFPGVTLNGKQQTISLGEQARFGLNEWRLSPVGEIELRKFVPMLLNIAQSKLGQTVLKRIVVEGFTDTSGTYLSNLNLSLMRSQSVLCALFAQAREGALTPPQVEQIRSLFIVGGYSFNQAKLDAEESRRVEFRLEFLGVGEQREVVVGRGQPLGECAIQ
jgi:outer membrane protein OmpA-like peptidoglycan-associated protein